MLTSPTVFTQLRRVPMHIQARWTEFRGFTPTDRNLFYLCAEIVPIGLASGMLAFNAPFILKLGASNALVGAMASLPALMVILFTLPFARFMDRVKDRRPWVTGSLAVSRMLYLFIALVPWLVPAEWQATVIVGMIVIQAIPLALFNTAFWVLIADICPADRRSSLFATRATLLSASVGISAFLSGIFLDLLPTPLNFQILNLLGFVLAQYSTYIVHRVTHPPQQPSEDSMSATDTGITDEPPQHSRLGLRAFFRSHRPFVNFNLTTLICWFGAWGAGPLYTIYLVRNLEFSNSWIGTNATLAQIAVVLSAPLWGRLITRKGNLWVVLRTVVLTGLYPLLIVLFPFPVSILLIGFFNTLNDTGLGIAHTAIFLDVIPPQRRNSFIAMHTTLMNVGAMAAPLLTAPFADVVGVTTVLIICGGIRFIGGTLFWFFPPVHKGRAGTTAQPNPV